MGFWAEKRKELKDKLYFAYGINGNLTRGKINDATIEKAYAFGPFVSIQHYLSNHIMINWWTNIFNLETNQVESGYEENETKFFPSNIAITYFFN